ncbi:MAG: class I SAM-dependent methyltransferase [Acidimicrobiia bacterium]
MGEAGDRQERLLQEQIAYFEARAPEYDAGMVPDLSDPDAAEWQQLRAKVGGKTLTGDVVDLAAGTGLWTELLRDTANSVTLVDASGEALELARQRLGGENVSYVVADLFEWKSDRRHDVVFSSFWLSHVPPDLIPGFVDQVDSLCRPGGSVVLVDEHQFDDPGLSVGADDEDPWVSHRTVSDGRRYRLVKVSHDPASVAAIFQDRGWRTSMDHRGDRFYMLTAESPTP